VHTLIGNKNGDCATTNNPDMYSNLAKELTNLNNLMKLYSEGKTNEVATILNFEKYNSISVDLFNLNMKKTQYKDYETIRESSTLALMGMYKSIMEYNKYINDIKKLEEECAFSNMLKDVDKRNAYIANLRRIQDSRVFPDSSITVIAAEVSSEYLIYIREYGFPVGGVFNPDILASIIKDLKK
jgi:hypothetical protein